MTALPANTTCAAAFDSYEARVSAAEAAVAAGGSTPALGYIDIDLSQAQGDILVTVPKPDNVANWQLVAGTNFPSQLQIGGTDRVERGAGPIQNGMLYVPALHWLNVDTSAVDPNFAIPFRASASTPVPRAFDMGGPVIVVQDVWQKVGSDHVMVPFALVKPGDGLPYPASRGYQVGCGNGDLSFGDWFAPTGNYAVHPYHNSRRMHRIGLANQGKTGNFTVYFSNVTDGQQPSGGYSRQVTVHIVANDSDIPSDYVPTVYTDDPRVGIPQVNLPVVAPTYDDDLSVMTFRTNTNPYEVTTDKWTQEEFILNPAGGADFCFVNPGITHTISGRVIGVDEVFPLVTLPDGTHARKMALVDCRNDKIRVDTGGGFTKDVSWGGAALRRRILPKNGWLAIEVTPPHDPRDPTQQLPNMDFAIWRYIQDGREHDLGESLSYLSINHHDGGGGNTYGYTPKQGLFNPVRRQVRIYHFTGTEEHHWVDYKDGLGAQYLYGGEQFYPDVEWPFLNILQEGPGGAAGNNGDSIEYQQSGALLHRITSYETSGTEVTQLASPPISPAHYLRYTDTGSGQGATSPISNPAGFVNFRFYVKLAATPNNGNIVLGGADTYCAVNSIIAPFGVVIGTDNSAQFPGASNSIGSDLAGVPIHLEYGFNSTANDVTINGWTYPAHTGTIRYSTNGVDWMISAVASIPSGFLMRAGAGGSNVGSENFAGEIYSFEMRNAAGALLASPDFTSQQAGASSFTDAQGNLWTINAPAVLV